MRTLAFLVALGAVAVACPSLVRADVNDAERAAARDLFKQGDELQRAGKFADALDKFQRAEQVIQAPTNVLRIAECEAALNKLVESAESYRTVIRWPLPAGSPPAFQSAVDQAKGELAQVEPRVPKLVVQTTPASVADAQLVVDGTSMPGALIGVPVPIDPGDHKVLVSAPGYSSSEQTVTVRERDSKTVAVELKPIAGAPPAPPPPVATGTEPPPPPPAPYAAGDAAPGEPGKPARKKARESLLLGAHLGLEIPSGKAPLDTSQISTSGDSIDLGDESGPGLAYGLDGGVRFARHFYLGLRLEHAGFASGKNPGNAYPTSAAGSSVGSSSSNTTSLGVIGAFILDPERVTLYGEVGLQARWYNFQGQGQNTEYYDSGELLLGVGLWIPMDRWFRLIPIATAGLGPFGLPNNENPGSTQGQGNHAFFMLGVMGLTNLDL